MQILIDIIHASSCLPVRFVVNVFERAMKMNSTMLIDRLLSNFVRHDNYRLVLKDQVKKILKQMSKNDDSKNIRLFEQYHRVFAHSRTLTSSDDLCSILNRLIHSSSDSSISYSILDTRYLLAMIILNSLTSYETYRSFLQQTWTSIVRDTEQANHLQPVVQAYARQWTNAMTIEITIDDMNTLVKYLGKQYELLSTIMASMNQEFFEQWISKTLECIVRYCFIRCEHCRVNNRLVSLR
jgi:hypothetical protein